MRVPDPYLHFRRIAVLLILTLFGALMATLWAGTAPGKAQDTTPQAYPETVVNLATGHVLVVVAKGAILIGTIENPIEADTHIPVPVQISSSRVAVLLGAVDWIAPESKQQLARLDQELPHLRRSEGPTAPHLGSEAGREATDLEAVGYGLLDRLSGLAQNLHGKVDLAPDEPIAVLIIAGYLPGYGPEVWRVEYKIEQSEESQDYWKTRVLRPTYTQCWPPEKGKPRALLTFSYPPDQNGCATFAPRPRSFVDGDTEIPTFPASVDVARSIIEGDSSKVPAADATQSFRFAADILAHGARETIATISEESGFAWILPPPAETAKPNVQPQRPAGAPSLAGPRPSLVK